MLRTTLITYFITATGPAQSRRAHRSAAKQADMHRAITLAERCAR
jgi:hypothetical protein